MGDFKQFCEDMRATLDKRLNISPSTFEKQYFIVNPPMTLKSDSGRIDTVTSPTRFKILSMGKNFLRVKNISFGQFPYEEKSKNAGSIYTITGPGIDLFLKPPPGTGEGMPTPGSFGSSL